MGSVSGKRVGERAPPGAPRSATVRGKERWPGPEHSRFSQHSPRARSGEGVSRKDGKGGRAFAGLPQAEEITLTTADSERLVAWHVAPRSDRPVILYLQGNGGSLRHRVHRFARLVQDGFGVFAVSYRGFGGSTGSPSETGLLLDAAAGYAFCADRYGAERIVVWGESLVPASPWRWRASTSSDG